MILRLFRRTPRADSIAGLYGTIVAQARMRAFYRIYGVPDTVDGRFEMIVLHTVLLLQRLEREPAPVRALGQGIFDRFCRDMDESMREMGVGDLAVPRKMRRIGEAFYGRQATYREALSAATRCRLGPSCDAMCLPRRRLAPASICSPVCAGGRALASQNGFDARSSPFPIPSR